jgi:hypothetical protein
VNQSNAVRLINVVVFFLHIGVGKIYQREKGAAGKKKTETDVFTNFDTIIGARQKKMK